LTAQRSSHLPGVGNEPVDRPHEHLGTMRRDLKLCHFL